MPRPPARPARLALLAALAACSPPSRAADLVVFGRVWTGDSTAPWAQAVAVRGERILVVGDSADVARAVGTGTEVLHGRMVLPGLTDSHVHFISGGFLLASLDLGDARDREEFTRRVGAFATERQPGEWILGGNWDHEKWPGAPLPSRQWIDAVTGRNPVFLRRLDGHMGLANSAALAAAGITRTTRDPAGGTIVRDARGEPTGILKDNAMDLVDRAMPAPTPAQLDAALQRALDHAASLGITAVSTVSTPWQEVAALQRARQRGTLTARVSVYVPLDQWRAMADTVAVYGPGDNLLRIAGVKGYVDGSLGASTALLEQPYTDEPDTHGLLVTPEDSLRRWIGAADSAGLQVVVHAIGDSANKLLLGIFDSVARAHGPRDRRFRVEHAQHLQPAEIGRFGGTGIIASMQAVHLLDDGIWAGKRLGPARVPTSYALRSVLAGRGVVALGSDWPVATLDPLPGIYAAVTRRTPDGKHPDGWVPSERLTLDEALHGYTTAGAYAAFAEQVRGRLLAGELADIVLLDKDLSAADPEEIRAARVLATVVGGRIVFRR